MEDVLYLKDLLENDTITSINILQKELQLGELQDNYSQLVKALQEYEVFEEEKVYEFREKAASDEIEKQKIYLSQLMEQNNLYKESYCISQERCSTDSILYEMKALSSKEYEQSLLQKNEDRTRFNQSNLDIINITIHLAQLKRTLKEFMAEEKKEHMGFQTTIMRLKNQLKSNILLWEQTYLLKAPVSGIVNYAGVLE